MADSARSGEFLPIRRKMAGIGTPRASFVNGDREAERVLRMCKSSAVDVSFGKRWISATQQEE